jgi:hypothetical protein
MYHLTITFHIISRTNLSKGDEIICFPLVDAQTTIASFIKKPASDYQKNVLNVGAQMVLTHPSDSTIKNLTLTLQAMPAVVASYPLGYYT